MTFRHRIVVLMTAFTGVMVLCAGNAFAASSHSSIVSASFTDGACGGGQTFDQAVAGWKAHGTLDDVMRWAGVDPNGADGKPIDQLRKTLVHVQVVRGSSSVSNNTCGKGMFQPLAKSASQAAGTFIWTTREKIGKDGSVHEWFAADCGNLRGGLVFVPVAPAHKVGKTGSASPGCSITNVHASGNSIVNVACGDITNRCSNATNHSTNCTKTQPAAAKKPSIKKAAYAYTCPPQATATINGLAVTLPTTLVAASSPTQSVSKVMYLWEGTATSASNPHTYSTAGPKPIIVYTTFKNGYVKGCKLTVSVQTPAPAAVVTPPAQQEQQQQQGAGAGQQQQQQQQAGAGQQQQQQQQVVVVVTPVLAPPPVVVITTPAAQKPTISVEFVQEVDKSDFSKTPQVISTRLACGLVGASNGDSLTVTFKANYGSFKAQPATFVLIGTSQRVCATYTAPSEVVTEQITMSVVDNTTTLNSSAVSNSFGVVTPKAPPQ